MANTFNNIIINKKPYKVEADVLTGEQILQVAGLSSAKYSLFLVHGNEQEEISPNQEVTLRNGMKFQAIISDIKFG